MFYLTLGYPHEKFGDMCILRMQFWCPNDICNCECYVFRHLRSGIADWHGKKQEDWVMKHPGQVVLTVVMSLYS